MAVIRRPHDVSNNTKSRADVLFGAVDKTSTTEIENLSVRKPYRKYIPWKEENSNPLPCIIDLEKDPSWYPLNDVETRQPSNDGLLFVKIEKAASTTLGSVAARIAHSLAHRVDLNVTRPRDGLQVQKVCKSRISHMWWKRTKTYSTRDKDRSFLWSFLKDPTKRILSYYFFFIIDAEKKQTYTEGNLISWLRQEKKKHPGGQLHDITDKYPSVNLHNFTDDEIQSYIQKTIDSMDFIGLVERMNESLVLLQLMLDLKPSDVAIVASSKKSGDYIIWAKKKKNWVSKIWL